MPLYSDYYGSSPYGYGGGLSPYGSPYSSSSGTGFSKTLSSVLNYGLDMGRGGVISISNTPGPYYLDTRSWVAPMSPRYDNRRQPSGNPAAGTPRVAATPTIRQKQKDRRGTINAGRPAEEPGSQVARWRPRNKTQTC